MIARGLWVALCAGLVAGLLVTFAQSLSVSRLILAAETYEAASADHEHGEAPPVTPANAPWMPADGLERVAYSGLANILAGVGFGLLIVAGFIVRGRGVGWRGGLIWGMAGFGVFAVAPALGLPPELPGVEAADLLARQAWWLGTVVATAAGLAMVVLGPGKGLKGAGLILLVLPHLIGAPHPGEMSLGVPAALAAEFAVASLATGAFFWAALGGVAGHLFDRWAR